MMEEQSSTESLCQLASKGDPEADTRTPTIFERVLGVHSMSGMCSAHCAVTIVQNCVSAVLVGADVILSEDGMFGGKYLEFGHWTTRKIAAEQLNLC